MKKVTLLILLSAMILSGCDNNEVTRTYTYQVNEPVMMSRSDFNKSIKTSTVPEQIEKQGKICFYEGYLYISEPQKGIHIINNQNPSSPQNVGYIELMGNADLAIRNNMLYADSFTDLVWFDISNPAKPELKNRLENAFPTSLPPTDNYWGVDYRNSPDSVIVGWTTIEKTETYTYKPCKDCDYVYANAESSSGTSGGKGANGSMSRFGLYQDYLYVVLNNRMSVFNLAGDQPEKASQDIPVGWDVETIFSYKDCMFLGTPTGMLIYSVKNPLIPEYQSAIRHIYGCDPVVVENDMAYVTIRSGNNCGQNNNELFIVDVSDVKNPKQIVSYTMHNPKGLGIDNNTLFICDEGLKVYNAQEPQKIMSNLLAHYKGMDGFDVIPYNNILMMIADDGLYQYDYSDLNDIKELSKLPIGK
ncbi:MAG: hypothetical protein E6767_06980 [Dysgonomonas sp.]|nr:hypothetical protein [Dysgonomonas sp.]